LVRQAAEEGLHGRKLIATRIRGLDIRQVPVGLREQPTDYVDERDKIASALARMDSLPEGRPPASASPPAPVSAGAPAPQETAPAAEAQSAWGYPVSMRIGEVLTGLVLVACSVFFGWQAALLPFGTVGLPGPGFFPFALAIVLGALALVIVLYALRNADRRERLFIGHRDVLVAIAALIGVAIAFERGDTYLVLGAFTLVLLVTVGRTKWWRAVIGAGLGMVAVWAVFSRALGVRLPVGEVWDQFATSIGAALASAPF
jgi:putative tricarboxylic transport membrane protein